MTYFIAPYIEYKSRDIDFYESGHAVAKFRHKTYSAGLDIGKQLGHWGSFRLGPRWVDGEADIRIGDPGFGSYDYNKSGFKAVFAYDTMDNITFPRDGMRAELSAEIDRESMGSDESVELFHLDWKGAKTWGRYTFIPGLTFSTVSDDDTPIQYASQLGGFLNLSGLIPDELIGIHSGVGKLVMYRTLGEATKRPFFLGGSVEYGNVWNTIDNVTLDSAMKEEVHSISQ